MSASDCKEKTHQAQVECVTNTVEDVEWAMDEIERAKVFEDAAGESLGRLELAFHTANHLVEQIQAAHRMLSEAAMKVLGNVVKDSSAPLEEGDCILDGRYRIVQLLYRRPRLNLYLGRRLLPATAPTQAMGRGDIAWQEHEQQEPLVAIRELILVDLPEETRKQIEAAAFEEFVSPVVLGSPRLPSAGDRARTQGARHYLIMQLRGTRGAQQSLAITLEELLLKGQQWPYWLSSETTLTWGTQLCRIVARLHRLGVVLGDLSPATVLVDSEGRAPWAPVLLVSWAPAPQFWPEGSAALYAKIFPIANAAPEHAFVAPEMLLGICDERSDVYALGAILYLLLTRYAPVAATRRLYARRQEERELRKIARAGEMDGSNGRGVALEEQDEAAAELDDIEGLTLIPPRLFNRQISHALERVLLRALELDPPLRYPTVFEMVEALEAVGSGSDNEQHMQVSGKFSPMRKVLAWLRWHSV